MPDASSVDKSVIPNVDVRDGDIVIINGAGEFVTFEDRKTHETRTRLRIPVLLSGGMPKEITLNETSRKKLVRGYGKTTETWVGKEALISVITKDVFGEFKPVLYVSPVVGG